MGFELMLICRRTKVAGLSLLLGMLLVFQIGLTTVIAQDAEFPVDLVVNYEFWINHWIPEETPIGITLEYSITDWIDKENLTVEYYLNSSRFEDRLNNIKIETTDYPPIWTNVSTWEVGNTIQLSGLDYAVAQKTFFKWVPQTDYFECYKLERGFLYSNLFNSTSIFYEVNLGLLVGFFKSVGRTDDGSSYYPIHTVDVGIIETNFDLFQSLIEDPYGTSTTSTTTTTPSTTTMTTSPTSETTIQISEPTQFPMNNTIVALSVGIVIECIIAVLLIIRKQSYSQ
jgi:hypothetical protein